MDTAAIDPETTEPMTIEPTSSAPDEAGSMRAIAQHRYGSDPAAVLNPSFGLTITR